MISRKNAQAEKAEAPISVRLGGSVILIRDVHCELTLPRRPTRRRCLARGTGLAANVPTCSGFTVGMAAGFAAGIAVWSAVGITVEIAVA